MMQTVLGIDYGTNHTGVAFGKNGLVAPLKVISGKDPNTAINELAKLAYENKITSVILGLPLTFDGKETPQSLKTRRFAKLLKIYIKKPVIFINEVNTSNEAEEEIISHGISQKKRRTADHYSAALILKRYYEQAEA